jgi:hypothetical protein
VISRIRQPPEAYETNETKMAIVFGKTSAEFTGPATFADGQAVPELPILRWERGEKV